MTLLVVEASAIRASTGGSVLTQEATIFPNVVEYRLEH